MLYNVGMAPVEVVLLGSFQIRYNGQVITSFKYDKVRALLAYLAVEREYAHRRDELIGLFWPDSAEENARNSLRQALAQLRMALGDSQESQPAILITRESVQWNPAVDANVDVVRFEEALKNARYHTHRSPVVCRYCAQQLAHAAELYQGDFLAHFFLPNSAPFEDWAVLKREALQRQALEALAWLACYYERSDDLPQAEACIRRQLAIEPWQEESHRRLMRILATKGQAGAALAQYETCRQQLADSLGVTPQPETAALFEAIRSGRGISASPADGPHPLFGRKHNLPPSLTTFVGREKELAALHSLLDQPDPRLITITGPGGVGKTRLALQVGADQVNCFTDGVFFVPLASIHQVDLLPASIGSALQLPPTLVDDPAHQLIKALADSEVLLILDNLEHLPGAGDLIGQLLACAPGIAILATSRERLNLRGEWVFPLAGLPAAEPGTLPQQREGTSADLFIQNAARLQPGFSPEASQYEAITQICWLVEGIPLAIELAAAWTHLLPCTEIAQEIQRDIDFLVEAKPDAPTRHASMRAVFDHSWSLLSSQEQSVFRKLSVFRGGFQREAAERVVGAGLPQLRSLLDKSLIKRTPFDRYDLHDLARQYAFHQMVIAGEEKSVRDQALFYYLNLAQIASPLIEGEHGPEWLERLEEEMDNFRAALEWSLSSGQIESGMRLAWALYRFWYWRNQHAREGRRWLEALLAAAEGLTTLPADLLGNVQYETGVIASMLKEFQPAVGHFSRSLALRQSIGDKEGQSAVINSLGTIAFEQQDLAKARTLFEESLALHLEIGKNPAVRLSNLGMIAFFQGDYAKAREYIEKSLQINRETNNLASLAGDLCSLAGVEVRQGDRKTALAHLLECLWLRREVDDNEGIAYALEGFASYYACGGPGEKDPYLAAQLFGAAEELRRTIGIPLSQVEWDENRRFLDPARILLGEDAFNKAWQGGRAAHIGELIREILSDYTPEKQSANIPH